MLEPKDTLKVVAATGFSLGLSATLEMLRFSSDFAQGPDATFALKLAARVLFLAGLLSGAYMFKEATDTGIRIREPNAHDRAGYAARMKVVTWTYLVIIAGVAAALSESFVTGSEHVTPFMFQARRTTIALFVVSLLILPTPIAVYYLRAGRPLRATIRRAGTNSALCATLLTTLTIIRAALPVSGRALSAVVYAQVIAACGTAFLAFLGLRLLRAERTLLPRPARPKRGEFVNSVDDATRYARDVLTRWPRPFTRDDEGELISALERFFGLSEETAASCVGQALPAREARV